MAQKSEPVLIISGGIGGLAPMMALQQQARICRRKFILSFTLANENKTHFIIQNYSR